ncbi:tetratricopeptide repeat protein [Kineococcus sp. R86509]|uniref:tetratricopeptide repeat protein n=1 Tax=Kineococcus sp. R86509 TaxID=3093851 RepID=UPI0036D20BB9
MTDWTPDVRLRRAEALADAGRWDQSLRAVHDVLASDPHHGEALRLAAMAELQLDRPEAAAQAATAAIAAEPQHEHGHRLLSVALQRLGHHDAALQAARDGVRANPHHPYALAQLATVLSDRRSTRREAVTTAERAVAAGPGMAHPLFVLGLALQQRGRRGRARRAYAAALELDPQHPEALNNLGVIALNSHRLGGAARFLGDSLLADPHSATARFNVDVLALAFARRIWIGSALAVLALLVGGAVESGTGTGFPVRLVVLLVAVAGLGAWTASAWRSTPTAVRAAVLQRSRQRPLLVSAWVIAALLLLACVGIAVAPLETVAGPGAFEVFRVLFLVNVVFGFVVRRSRPRRD